MLVSEIEIFLKNKEKSSVNMVVNNIRIIFKKFFQYARNKGYQSIKHFLLYLLWVGPQNSQSFLGKYKKFFSGWDFLNRIQDFTQGWVFLVFKLWLEIAPGYYIFHYLQFHLSLKPLTLLDTNCTWRNIKNGRNGT